MNGLKTTEVLHTIHMADIEVKIYKINNREIAKKVIQNLIINNLNRDDDGCYIDISELDLLLKMIPIVTNLRVETDKAKDMLKKLYNQQQPEIMDMLEIFKLQIESAKLLIEDEYNKRE